jgi:hypothetical protein
MTKKETLRLSNDDNGNVLLFTIVSSESDLHICMLINKAFQISMSLSDDLEIKYASGIIGFKKYQFEQEVEEERFTLLINHHSTGKYLFPEFKKIDFILIISSESNHVRFENQIKKLKESPGVSAIFRVDPSTIKSYKRIGL